MNKSEAIDIDKKIKETSLKNFKEKVNKMNIPNEVKDWLLLSVRIHYGSGEVDDLLNFLGCYDGIKNEIKLDRNPYIEKCRFIIPIRSYLQENCVGIDVKDLSNNKGKKVKFSVYPKNVKWFDSFSYVRSYDINDKQSIEDEKYWIRTMTMNEQAYFLTLTIIDSTSITDLKTKSLFSIVKQYFLTKNKNNNNGD